MALGPLWMLNIGISLASLGLLIGLVFVYGRNLRDLRSPFTIGLFAFGALLLLQSLMAVFVYMSMAEQDLGGEIAIPMLVLNVAGLAGFASLFLATWR